MRAPLLGAALGAALLTAAAPPIAAQPQPRSSNAPTARQLLERGRAAHDRGDRTLAIELYKAALAENPRYADPLTGLADAFFDLGEYEEALVHIVRARGLDNDLALVTREARIRIGTGDLVEARSLFEQVLDTQPNNAEARFGLAEVEVAEGRPRLAAQRYQESLRLAPRSRRGLLSLALVYEELGDPEAAARYLQLALRYHGSDPEVHFVAGRTLLRDGAAERAAEQLRTALSLRPEYTAAKELLAEVYLLAGRPADAVTLLERAVGDEPANHLLWYLLGRARERGGNLDGAVAAYRSALRLRVDDEVTRIVSESLVMSATALDHPARAEMAAAHLQAGRRLRSRNFLAAAAIELRRAVQLDPQARDARLARANIERLAGFPLWYFDQLQVLRAQGFDDDEITDALELMQSRAEASLAARNGIDQYALQRLTTPVAVFHYPSRDRLLHAESGNALVEYFIDQLLRDAAVDVVPDDADTRRPFRDTSVAAFDLAFRRARADGSVFFLVLELDEAERSFQIDATLYLSATGAELYRTRVFRTGNDRVRDAVSSLVAQLHDLLPRRFQLLSREFGVGIIDGGRRHGVEPEQRMLIVKPRSVGYLRDRVGLTFAEQDVLGELVITEVDEAIAAGSVERLSFFDFINPGDEVVVRPAGFGEPPPPAPAAPERNLFQRLLARILDLDGA